MTMLYFAFAVIALVCFGLGALNHTLERFNLIALGLFFLVLNIVISIGLDYGWKFN